MTSLRNPQTLCVHVPRNASHTLLRCPGYLAARLLPLFEQVISYEGHTTNVTAVGFQKEGRWIYSCSEDGSVKIWDLRAPGCQRDYESKAPVNTVVLHPNQVMH